MLKKLTSLMLCFMTLPIFADTTCPPASEIHCHNSQCELGPSIQPNWKIYAVAGIPQHLQFWLAGIAFTPAPVNCVYGSSEGMGSAVTLMSNDYYAPDNKAISNEWHQTNYTSRCGSGQGPMNEALCPIFQEK